MTAWMLTGLSGAGKATALAALEQSGVQCVDNLPVSLLQQFVNEERDRPAAAVIDARQGTSLDSLSAGFGARILFLDARDDVLVRRLAESTRPHPCAAAGGGQSSVNAERALLQQLRASADVVIDTTELEPAQLRARVRELIAGDDAGVARLQLTISSFGYKFGAQLEADWVIDARMMRNPFWVAELRPLTGLDDAVRDYVLEDERARELISRLSELLSWACPQYVEHGRRHLHVAIGCTGGRHRSVVLVGALAKSLNLQNTTIATRHRDVDKSDPR